MFIDETGVWKPKLRGLYTFTPQVQHSPSNPFTIKTFSTFALLFAVGSLVVPALLIKQSTKV